MRLELLFPIISSSNYRERDMKINNHQELLLSVFFYQKQALGAVSRKRFIYALKTYVIIGSY